MNINANIIRVKEYDSIKVGEDWNSSKKQVSDKEVEAIADHLALTGCELFTFGHRMIKATNWVGTLSIGDKCIEVYPKIDTPDDLDSLMRARENLIHMISVAGYAPFAEAGLSPLLRSEKPLITAYMEIYVDYLTREWRKGMIREYVVQEENKTFLKGKLLMKEHLRSNMVRRDRFFTSCDEFIEDNNISQILKAALLICRSQKISDTVSRKSSGLLMDFESVSSVNMPGETIDRISIDRRHTRYEPVFNLAKMVLRMTSPDSPTGGPEVYSLMFDMNEVFERFVAEELRRALSNSPFVVRYQMGGKSLLRKNGDRRFGLKPDFGIFDGKEVVCLLDTKWKKLDLKARHSNVAQSDMYQMYAYGKEYDSPLTILVYPRFENLPEVVAEYHHNEDDEKGIPRKIKVSTIDVSLNLSLIINQIEFSKSLKRLVDCEDELKEVAS